ncbi:transcriptional regulator of RNA polII, SAGA, subunit-domain-containing protein [Cyathus striatus]|nr:transcriptional regulator of RNA polII, SAGA, subunit-domain-containing protein [Cyathus striatus]
MSLSSTSTIKQQLTTALGPKASSYFQALNSFVTGKTSRAEFEDSAKELLTTTTLIQLHNALIISLFDATAVLKRPPTPPPPTLPKPPPRKRRRTLLPYQGPQTPEDARWALSVGRRERERMHSFQASPAASDVRNPMDEISSERGVVLLPEKGNPPGSRLPVNLHSVTRAPTMQHIADRINLICAQNNLGPPSRTVPSLMSLACEAKLKQLITRALTFTSTSHAITSITPSSTSTNIHSSTAIHHQPSRPPVLTPASFQNLFTLSPAELPNKSAAAMHLSLSGSSPEEDDTEELAVLKDREVRDQRWQIMALLGERSTVREGLKSAR